MSGAGRNSACEKVGKGDWLTVGYRLEIEGGASFGAEEQRVEL